MGRVAKLLLASSILAVAAAAPACTLLNPLGDYAGSADEASLAESREAATNEVLDASDASVRDAPAEASGPFLCSSLATKPTFCDDFERSGDLKGDWTLSTLSGGGAVTLAEASSGRELRATLPSFTGSGIGQAGLDKSIHTTTDDVTFAYRLQIDAAPPNGALQIMSIFLKPADSADYTITFLMARSTGLSLGQQTFVSGGSSVDYREDPIAGYAFGAMHGMEVHLALSAPPRVTVKVDGAVALDAPLFARFRPAEPIFSAGLHYAEPPAGPLSLRIDDVVIDLR